MGFIGRVDNPQDSNIFRDEVTPSEMAKLEQFNIYERCKIKSNIDLLKEEYESGNYLIVFKQKKVNDWDFCYRPNDLQWRNDFDYKLIHKNHEDVLRAYLDGKEIEIHIKEGLWLPSYFIELYDEYRDYRIKEKNGVREDNKVKNKNVSHYDLWNGFEAIDVMKKVLSKDEYIGYLKGNILKYQIRLGKKDNVGKELVKIQDYTNELNSIFELSNENN